MPPPEPSPADEARRFQRRLDREIAARREAEQIAEKGLRDLWDRQRALVLLECIANTGNNAASSREAFQTAIKEVCAFTGWPVGHVYLTERRDGGPCMVPVKLWCGASDPRLAEFRRLTEASVFPPGLGLPGRVLESKAPFWIPQLDDDPLFPRGDVAIRSGLKTALAFPVMVRDEVAAVLEFFTPEFLPPNAELLTLMGQVGAQLGRAVERERAHERLKRKNQRLRQLVRRAEEARKAAEAASSAKSAFLAVTSHEIRTPLNVVLGMAEALRREPLTEHQGSLVEGVIDSGAMLLRLLNAVLDLSKIEAGQSTLDRRPYALDESLATVARVWEAKAKELGLTLVLDLDGLSRPAWINADAGKIEQCLVNLISNAMKFTPRGGGVRVTAADSTAGARQRVEITVDDDGPGVAAEDRERILKPYVQTEVGQSAGGAGLGLSICAGHMELMGGELLVGQSPSGGGRFTLAFPVDAAEPQAKSAAAPIAAPADAGTARLLIAEDHPGNRRVLQVLLEPLGLDLTFAVNGQEAVEAMQVAAFDLVLMDANMPVMNGTEAVRTIRALAGPAATTPIHMLTANVFEEDRRAYHAAGADGVLCKPLQLEQLFAVLCELPAPDDEALVEPAALAS